MATSLVRQGNERGVSCIPDRRTARLRARLQAAVERLRYSLRERLIRLFETVPGPMPIELFDWGTVRGKTAVKSPPRLDAPADK